MGTNVKSTYHELMNEAASHGYDIASLEFAQYLDSQDEFKEYRELFYVPRKKTLPQTDLSLVDGESESVYLLGNSLGLQPKQSRQDLMEYMDKWAEMLVFIYKYNLP
ncbi:uncharacterized protein TRIADDRAFT_58135 [Trichoplax adhaerens]|uniref:Uncharacterized protein n=1 Tax=Trichoplax adhaerens TaxID=10228 RepID=B3S0Z0_TRIAD|nr:hypothetical protein TRIADDRAFT_58135 [Trichoplax adhaerens]EDV23145.1 hypothetical protein TRIADDRAFT_58135 [Trichoplax adhaerens]|eukprot:XP_002114055.1 hypothetical protein TRIADDRAFT_58135 [Trichoplax adhaerens]